MALRISGRPVTARAKSRIVSLALLVGSTSAIICPLLAPGTEELWFEIDDAGRLKIDRLGEIRRCDFRTLWHADKIQDEFWFGIVRPGGPDRIEQTFGVAQIGEVWRGDEHNFVGTHDHPPHPSRPAVRNVEDDAGRRSPEDVNDRIESGFGKIVHAVECGRRSQEAKLIAAAGQ